MFWGKCKDKMAEQQSDMMTSEDSSSDSDDCEEEILLFLLLMRRACRRVRASNRKQWSTPWILRRDAQGAHANLVRELSAEDPEGLRRCHRMDRESFHEILAMVSPLIVKQDTHLRRALKPAERLSVTLRFLATGETFRSLSFQYRMGERTISFVVEETCQALYITLKEQHLKTPSSASEWREIATEFETRWNYPCCLGAIDGKHIAIQQPSYSGSEFFNYKHFFSFLLVALVDANYKFIHVDVGAAGRAGDAGVYSESTLKKAISSNLLDVPPPICLQGNKEFKVHYHMVCDDAFPLSNNMMKPFPHRNLEHQKRIFNYRLSRARRVVENAFGILAHRWRVFLTAIKMSPDKVTNVISATCCLHNFLVDKNKGSYTSAADSENADYNVSAGVWRNDKMLPGMQSSSTRDPPRNAKAQREILTTYFNNAGSVPWQNNMIVQ